jgi:hypothetical protein
MQGRVRAIYIAVVQRENKESHEAAGGPGGSERGKSGRDADAGKDIPSDGSVMPRSD